jgi:hypothetical protein
LKKTFQKLDHDVNIREFIASSNSTVEDLSTQARILQARISEIHGRLSYWTEPDKINNVEHLGQLEISIRQSLDQLRAHKEHFGQQQQAMQIENANFVKDWSTCSVIYSNDSSLVLICNKTNCKPGCTTFRCKMGFRFL